MVRGQRPFHTSPCQVTMGVPQLSEATTREIPGAGASVTRSKLGAGGQVIEGGVRSSTVMVWVQEAVLPQESTAWYVLVMMRGQVPFHTSLTQVTVGVPQLSEATTREISGAGTSLTHSKVRFVNDTATTEIYSLSLKVALPISVLPQESTA